MIRRILNSSAWQKVSKFLKARDRAIRLQTRSTNRVRPELLEDRIAPATLYVDNAGDYLITTDNGPVGLSVGDIVTWNPSGLSHSGPVVNLVFGTDAFSTITSALAAAAASGDTILIAEGTFNEQFTITKQVQLIGAGNGDSANDTIIESSIPGPIISITGSGLDASNHIVVSNLRVTGATGSGNTGSGVLLGNGASFLTFDGFASVGNEGHGIAMNSTGSMQDLRILNSLLSDNEGAGFRIPTSLVSLDGLTITNSVFSGNDIGINVFANTTNTTLTNVNISNTQLTNNISKGAYFERLSNATLSGLTVSGNGTGPANPAGIDINLKYADYSNITIEDSAFTNNGTGGANGQGLTIKGRNDGSYSGDPASLTGLTLDNVDISGSPVALELGNNINLGSVTLTDVVLSGTGRGLGLYGNPPGTLDLGNTNFDGTLTVYIRVESSNVSVDAAGATFDTVDLSLGPVDAATKLAIGAKIEQGSDFGSVVHLAVGEIFVTNGGSIQQAIDNASPYDTVLVGPGTYDEIATINKPITLEGLGAVMAPTTGVQQVIISIDSDNVTIRGMELVVNQNDDPNIGDLAPIAPVGIAAVHTAFDNLVLEYNKITSIGDNTSVNWSGTPGLSVRAAGIVLYDHSSGGIPSVTLTGNDVSILSGTSFFQRAVWLAQLNANITDNIFAGAANDLIFQFPSGGPSTIDGNQFLGIHDQGGGGVVIADPNGEAPITITNNTFTALPLPFPLERRGLQLNRNVAVGSEITIEGNTFTGHTIGIDVAGARDAIITGNTFTAKPDTAGYIHIQVNSQTASNNGAVTAPVNATIDGNSFLGGTNSTGSAIEIFDTLPSANYLGVGIGQTTANTYANLTTGIEIHGGVAHVNESSLFADTGIVVNGGTLNLAGSTINSTDIGIALNGTGILNLGAGNILNGTGTGLAITGGAATVTGNNLGDLSFAGQTNYIVLAGGALAGQTLNATGVSFDGKTGTSANLAENFAIEDKITHATDDGTLGFVRVSAGEVFVTPNSGSIQRGVSAAAVTDTVHVASGTFNEDVLINKTLVLAGAGPGLTTVSGPIGGETATIRISANNVEVSGFTITREGNNATDWSNPNLNSAGIAIQGPAFTGAEIHDNLITGNRTGIDINNSNGHTVRNNVIENNHTGLIFRNQTDGLLVTENAIVNNRTVGILFLDMSGGTNSPLQQALGSVFFNNNISGNWYGQIVDRQAGGSLPAPGTTNLKNFSGNWFGTDTPVITTADSAEPAYADLLPVVFGGTATAPGGQPEIAGAGSGNFDLTPLLATGNDTNVETVPGRGTYGFQGDFSSLIVTVQGAQTGSTGRIQEGVNLVTSGGLLTLTAGTFNENVVINKHVVLAGAGAGSTIINGSGGGAGSTAIKITGSGASGVDRLIVRDLHVEGTHKYAFELSSTVSHITLEHVSAEGNENSNFVGGRSGIYAGGGAEISDLILDDIELSGFGGGAILFNFGAKADGFTLTNSVLQNNRLAFINYATLTVGATNEATLTNVLIENNQILNNSYKGLYFEALNNAVIRGNTFVETGVYSGTDPDFGAGNQNSAVELNLKNGNFSNIQIVNNTFTDSGLHTGSGTNLGGALAIKPRDASGYATIPGYLDNVEVSGNVFSVLNADPAQVRSILIGEPGQGTATPTNLVITDNVLSDGTFTGLVNTTTPNAVDASVNWWGTIDESEVLALIQGGVDFSPYLNSGTDANGATPGFQGDRTTLHVTSLGEQVGTLGRIEEAFNLVPGVATLTLSPGIYNEDVSTLGKQITLSPGASLGQVIINGDLKLDSDDTLVIEILGNDPSTEYNNFIVNGTVTLGGATLSASSSILSSPGSYYVLIDNDGNDPVSGTFAGLNDGDEVTLGGVVFRITYAGGDGNDVVLFAEPTTGVILEPDGDLIISDIDGADTNDNIKIWSDGDYLYVEDPDNFLFAGGGAFQVDSHTVRVLLASITGQITFDGLGGSDRLTVDVSGGIDKTINFLGGAGNDFLTVIGDLTDATSAATYTPDLSITGAGVVEFVSNGISGVINFSGLEPVDITGFATATLNLPGGDDVLTVANGLDYTTGSIPATRVTGTTGGVAIEAVAFFNNGTVVIDTTAVDGNDTITITSVNNDHQNQSLTINTGVGTDNVDINGAITLADTLSITSPNVVLNSAISADGGVSIDGPMRVAGVRAITTAGGDVSVTGDIVGTTGGGGEQLTINAATGNVSLAGISGLGGSPSANGLTTLTIAAAQSVAISGPIAITGALNIGNVTPITNGTTFSGTVSVGSAAISGNTVNVNSTLTSTNAVSITNTGLLTAQGLITAGGVGFSASGDVLLQSGITTTAGGISIGGATTASGGNLVTLGSGTNSINLDGGLTITGGTDLVIDSDGAGINIDVAIYGEAGGAPETLTLIARNSGSINLPKIYATAAEDRDHTGLISVTIENSSNITYNHNVGLSGALTHSGPTSGVTTFNGTVEVGSINLMGQAITFDQDVTVDDGDMIINQGGNLTLSPGADITLTKSGAAFTASQTGGSDYSLGGNIITNGGDITIGSTTSNDVTSLTADVIISTGGGNVGAINFSGAILGSGHGITLNAGSDAPVLLNIAEQSTGLDYFTIQQAGTVNISSVAAGSIDITATGPLTVTGTLTATVAGGINVTAGSVSISSSVSSTTGPVNIEGATTVTIGAITTNDPAAYISLTAGTTLTIAGNIQTDGGDVTLNAGSVVITSNRTIDTNAGANTGDSGNVSITGTIEAVTPVNLTINTVSSDGTAGNISLPAFSATNRINELNLDRTATGTGDHGTVTLNGNIYTSGPLADPGDVNITGPGAIILTNDVLIDTEDGTGVAGAVTFNTAATIDGAFSLTIDTTSGGGTNGNVTLGQIGQSEELTSVTVTGRNITAQAIRTTGSINLNAATGSLTLNGNLEGDFDDTGDSMFLTGTGITVASSVRIDAGAGDITFNGNSTGSINFSVADLIQETPAVTTTGSSIKFLNAVDVTLGYIIAPNATVTFGESGGNEITDDVTQRAGTYLDVDTINGSLAGAATSLVLNSPTNKIGTVGNLQVLGGTIAIVDSDNDLTVDGPVSSTGSLSIYATDGPLILQGNLTGGPITLNGTGINQSPLSTIDAGASTVLIDANDGTITMAGLIQTTNATTNAVIIRNATTTTLGDISAPNGRVTLGDTPATNFLGAVTQTSGTAINAATLEVRSDLSVILNQNNSINDLVIATTTDDFELNDTTGGLTISGPVNSTGGNVTITTAGGVLAVNEDINGGSVKLTGDGITSTNAGDVNATGDILLDGNDGDINLLGDLVTTSNTATAIVIRDASSLAIVTVNAGNGTVTLGQAGSDNIGGTITQTSGSLTANTLTGNALGAVTLNSTHLVNLGDFAVTGAGNAFTLVDVSGSLNVVGDVTTANGDVSITASASGNALIFGAGAGLNAGNGAVTLTASDLDLAPGTITTTGIVHLQPISNSTSIGLAGAAGTFTLSQADFDAITDDAAQIIVGRFTGTHVITANALTVRDPFLLQAPNAGGQITINGTLRGTATGANGGSIIIDGPGATTILNDNIITEGQTVLIDDSAVVGNGLIITIDTTDGGNPFYLAGADITIEGSLLGVNSGGSEAIVINAGNSGNILLQGTVGNGNATNLTNVTITNAADVTFESAVNIRGTLTQLAGQGTTAFEDTFTGGSVDLTGNHFTFTEAVNTVATNGTVTIANTGTLTLPATADLTLGGAFSQTGTGPVNIAADISTTSDNVSFNGPVNLTGPVNITTGTGIGDIIFLNTLDGTEDLTLAAATGNITFTGAVGGTTALNSLVITSAADVTANAISATTLNQIAGSGTTTFNGLVTVGTATLTGTNFVFNANLNAAGTVTLTNSGTAVTALAATVSGTVLTVNGSGTVGTNASSRFNTAFNTITLNKLSGTTFIAEADAVNVQGTSGALVDIQSGGDLTVAGALTVTGLGNDLILTAIDSALSVNAAIDVAGSVTLVAEGLFDPAIHAQDFTLSSGVSVTAGGDVTILAGDDITLLATSVLTVGGNLTIATEYSDPNTGDPHEPDGAGSVTLAGTINGGNLVNISAPEDIIVGEINAPGATVTLIADSNGDGTGGIYRDNIATSIVIADSLVASAAERVEHASDPGNYGIRLNTQVSNLTATVTAATSGGVNATIEIENTGALQVLGANVNGGTGDVLLTTDSTLTIAGNISSVAGNIVLTSTGDDILRTAGVLTALSGGVTLTAGGADGDIGASTADAIQTNTNTINFTGSGSGVVFITNANSASFSGSTGTGNISLRTNAGTLTIGGPITTTAPADVTLTAAGAGGNVAQGIGGKVTADRLTISVNTTIGSLLAPIATSINQLVTTHNTSNSGGDQFFVEDDGLTLLNADAIGSAVTGNFHLTLLAGAITDNDAGIDIQANEATVVAPGGIGTGANPIRTTVNSLTASTTNADQYWLEDNGLTDLGLNAGAGNVTLTLTAGGILDNANDGDDITAANVTVTLNDPTAQDIGASGNAIEVNTNTLTASTVAGGGSMYFTEANGLAAIDLNAGIGDVSLTLTLGDLADSDGAVDITAATATVTTLGAGANIGSGTPIQTSVDTLLFAATGAGNVTFVETDSANVSGTTGSGNITLTAGGDWTVIDPGVSTTGNVALTSIGGDLLRNGAAAVVAGNAVTLTAGGAEGDIGTAINPFLTSATDLVFTGTGTGNVFITETDGANVTGTTGAGSIDLVTLAGDWMLVAPGVSTVGNISITANDGSIYRTGAALILGHELTLTAGGADGDLGTAADPLLTTGTTINFAGSGTGDVEIEETNGAQVTGSTGSGYINLRTPAGDWTVISTGITTSGNVTLTANNGDLLRSGATAVVTGDLVTLTAGGADGNIGTPANPFLTEANEIDFTVTGSGNIDLSEQTSAIIGGVTGATNSRVNLQAGGSFLLNHINASPINTLATIIAGGAVLDNNGAANNLTALSAIISAGTGIGHDGVSSDAIETNIANLEAQAGNDGIYINEANALTVGDITPADAGLVATGGNIEVNSGTLTIAEVISTPGNVQLISTGSITETNVGRVDAALLTTRSTGGQVLNLHNTVGAFIAENFGAGTGISLFNDVDNFQIGPVSSKTGGEILIDNNYFGANHNATIVGKIESGLPGLGGDITVQTGGPLGGTLTVDAEVNSLGGSDGTLTITSNVILNASPVVGFGDITLRGGAGTLNILAPITVTSTLILTATEDVNILAKVETASVTADIEVLADSDFNGTGGVLIADQDPINPTPGYTGQLKSGRNIDIRGSEYAGNGYAPYASLAGQDNSVIILSNGAQPRVEAIGNILVKNNNTGPATAEIWLGGLVRSNTTGTISFDNAVQIVSDDARVMTHGDGNIVFVGPINSSTAHNLRLSTDNGVILFSGEVGGTAPLGDVLIDMALDVTELAGFAARSLTIAQVNGSTDLIGPVTISGTGTSLSINSRSLFVNGPVSSTGGGDIFWQTDNIGIDAAVSGSGTITMQPITNSRSIGINGVGDFNLTTTEVAFLQDGFARIVIGSPNGSGTITTQGITFVDPVELRSPAGGTAQVNGAIIGLDDASVTLNARTIRLNVDAAGTSNPAIRTDSGAIIIQGNVTLQTDTYLQTNNAGTGGDVTVDGWINGAADFTVHAGTTGAITLNGAANSPGGASIGGATPLESITLDGGSILLRPQTVTTGDQTYTSVNGMTTFAGPLRSTAGGDITINGPLLLAEALRVFAQGVTNGDITFNGPVDSVTPIGALNNIDAGLYGNVTFNGPVGANSPLADVVITRSNNTVFSSSVTVTDEIRINANEIDFLGGAGSVSGVRLTLQTDNATTPVLVGGANEIADSTLHLSNRDIEALADGFSSIAIARGLGTAGLVIHQDGVTFQDPVTFRQHGNNGVITVLGPVTGQDNASITFDAGATQLSADVTTNGGDISIKYARLNTSVTIASNGGNVLFTGDVADLAGNSALTVNAGTGNVTFTAKVGAKAPLLGAVSITTSGVTTLSKGLQAGSLEVLGGGESQIGGGQIRTFDSAGVHFSGPVTVNSSMAINARNGGSITFDSTIDSKAAKAVPLTLTSDTGNISVAGDVGGSLPLTNLKATTRGNVEFAGDIYTARVNMRAAELTVGNVTTTHNQTYTALQTSTFNGNLSALNLIITSNSTIANAANTTWEAINMARFRAKAGAGIEVTGSGHQFGDLQIHGANATIEETGDMNIATGRITGDLTLSATGSIRHLALNPAKTGALQVRGTTNLTAGSEIDFSVPRGYLKYIGNVTADGDIVIVNVGSNLTIIGDIVSTNGDVILGSNANRSGFNIINQSGSDAIQVSGGHRYVIYSYSQKKTDLGGLAVSFTEFGKRFPEAPDAAIGNGIIYTTL